MKLHLLWHYTFHFKCIIGFFFGKPSILCNKSTNTGTQQRFEHEVRELAQWVKYLLWEHETLSSDP